MFPPSIQKLIDLFSKFPTVGPRTAARFVFYLLKLPQEKFDELIKSMNDLRSDIKNCIFCYNPFQTDESHNILCPICRDNSRNKNLLCIVEKESDLISIENIKKYKGIYFILDGTVSALRKEDIEKLRVAALEERIKNPESFGLAGAKFQEIIIAANPTTEGDATALYLERKLKLIPPKEGEQMPKITRLGRGLPVGAELEYADEETLENAFEGRK